MIISQFQRLPRPSRKLLVREIVSREQRAHQPSALRPRDLQRRNRFRDILHTQLVLGFHELLPVEREA